MELLVLDLVMILKVLLTGREIYQQVILLDHGMFGLEELIQVILVQVVLQAEVTMLSLKQVLED